MFPLRPLLACVVTLAVLVTNCSGSLELTEKGLQNLQLMTSKVAVQGPVVQLTFKEYTTLVLCPSINRPYHVFVLFLIFDEECPFCRTAEKVFRAIAAQYHNHGLMEPFPNSHDGESSGALPSFFMLVDVYDDAKYAALHQIEGVPMFAYIKKENLLLLEGSDALLVRHDDSFPMEAESLLENGLLWINNKTGLKLAKKENFFVRLGATGALLAVGSCIGFIGWKTSAAIREKPWILSCIALLLQWLCTSGIILSIRRAVPLFGFNEGTLEPVFFIRSHRDQYFGEGILMGFMSVLFGVLLLYIARTAMAKKRGNKNVKLIMLLVGAILVHTVILNATVYKTGIGNHSIFPPAFYPRGPLNNDRKKSLGREILV